MGVLLANWGVPGCLDWLPESKGNLCSQSEMQEATEGKDDDEEEEEEGAEVGTGS